MKPKYYSDSSQNVFSDRWKFESCYLLSHQKSIRLRHLSQISAVNLNVSCLDFPEEISALPASKPLPQLSEGFFFTLSINKDQVIYTSEFQTGQNPSWNGFDMKKTVPYSIHSLQGIIVRIWLKRHGKSKHITSWGVNFSGLIPIGQFLSDLPNDMASNTIVLRLMGWLYTSPECLRTSSENPNKVPLFKSFSVPLSQTKSGCSVSLLMGLKTKKTERLALENKIGKLIKEYEENIQNDNVQLHKILGEIDVSRMLISRLKKQVDVELAKLAIKKHKLDDLDGCNQVRVSETLCNIRIMNRDLIKMKQNQELELEEQKKFQEIMSDLSFKRSQLISDLSLVYPIKEDSKGHFTICGVHLPLAEQYGGCSDQSLSVAIGYASHLVVRIAMLLNMPLPFPITLLGSQCTIADRITISSHDKNQKFQLYSRGKDRERTFFYYGVFLLNKNIAQLRWNCGLPSRDLRPTLQNLWQLIDLISNKSSSDASSSCFPDLSTECPLYTSGMIAELQETDDPKISRSNPKENGRVKLASRDPSPRNSPQRPPAGPISPPKSVTNDPEDISLSLDEGLDRFHGCEPTLVSDLSSSVSEINLQKDELPGPFVSTRNSLYNQGESSLPYLDDEEKKNIDDTFAHVMEKYFLKRSNSEDRITGLRARVPDLTASVEPESPQKPQSEVIVPIEERPQGSPPEEPQISAPSVTIPKEPQSFGPEDSSEIIPPQPQGDDALVDVFSRTKALASQNFSFKLFSKERPEKL